MVKKPKKGIVVQKKASIKKTEAELKAYKVIFILGMRDCVEEITGKLPKSLSGKINYNLASIESHFKKSKKIFGNMNNNTDKQSPAGILKGNGPKQDIGIIELKKIIMKPNNKLTCKKSIANMRRWFRCIDKRGPLSAMNVLGIIKSESEPKNIMEFKKTITSALKGNMTLLKATSAVLIAGMLYKLFISIPFTEEDRKDIWKISSKYDKNQFRKIIKENPKIALAWIKDIHIILISRLLEKIRPGSVDKTRIRIAAESIATNITNIIKTSSVHVVEGFRNSVPQIRKELEKIPGMSSAGSSAIINYFNSMMGLNPNEESPNLIQTTELPKKSGGGFLSHLTTMLPFMGEKKKNSTLSKELSNGEQSSFKNVQFGNKLIDIKKIKSLHRLNRYPMHRFGRSPSLTQMTGFVRPPFNISMEEAITGMKPQSYMNHAMSPGASPVTMSPGRGVAAANSFYGSYGNGLRLNPSAYGKKRRKTVKKEVKKRKVVKKISKVLKTKAKKLGVKLTVKRGDKRVKKSEKVLLKQIKTAAKRKAKAAPKRKTKRKPVKKKSSSYGNRFFF
jgi:hypothetical protein